jgi:DNA-binding PadR family transcriptional regulator
MPGPHDPFEPHDPRHQEGWRRFEQFARRGMRGFGGWGGFPGWDGLEGNFRIGRMLASGDLRLVALYLIEQQPRHGYDLIKAIEDKTAGFYSPSPGIVYPALTFLEEAGYVTSSAEGNKKLYTITDEGRGPLADNRTAVESTLQYLGKIGRGWTDMRDKMSETFNDTRDRMGRRGWREREDRGDRDIRDVLPEVNVARRALKAAIADAAQGDEETQRRLANILDRAAREIRELGQEPDDEIDV